jgi:hypothetical protein
MTMLHAAEVIRNMLNEEWTTAQCNQIGYCVYYMCIICAFYRDIVFPSCHPTMWPPSVICPEAACHRSTFYYQLIVVNHSTQLCPIGIEVMSCGWRGWNGLTCGQELQFKNSPRMDCCKIEHSAVFYGHRSIFSLKEKSWWEFLGSYNGVGNGHCAAIHHVEKMLAKNSFPTFYSFMGLNMIGRYY